MSDLYEYYRNYDESTRLTRSRLHYSEYLVMMHLLKKYLGSTPLKVLDCCAGCGIYSEALARMGHWVTAGDLIPEHVSHMRVHCTGLAEIYEGSVCDLSRFGDETFDAVLNFGAMYHLQDTDERQTAVRECLRVLKPGGVFAYTYQSLLAIVLGQYYKAVKCLDEREKLRCYEEMEKSRKTHCRDLFYGMTPEEIQTVAAENELEILSNACTYGALYPSFREIDEFSEAEYARYVEVCINTCEEKSIADKGMHGVCFTRKIKNSN